MQQLIQFSRNPERMKCTDFNALYFYSFWNGQKRFRLKSTSLLFDIVWASIIQMWISFVFFFLPLTQWVLNNNNKKTDFYKNSSNFTVFNKFPIEQIHFHLLAQNWVLKAIITMFSDPKSSYSCFLVDCFWMGMFHRSYLHFPIYMLSDDHRSR